jgi:hypothetical protein
MRPLAGNLGRGLRGSWVGLGADWLNVLAVPLDVQSQEGRSRGWQKVRDHEVCFEGITVLRFLWVTVSQSKHPQSSHPFFHVSDWTPARCEASLMALL